MERIYGPERKIEYIQNPHKALREKEAAEVLGVSVKTLQAWRFYCKGPKYLKIGRAVRYPVEYLDQFKESSTVNPMA
jgi:predicted DNA-binding transcriptional regulator AlpA